MTKCPFSRTYILLSVRAGTLTAYIRTPIIFPSYQVGEMIELFIAFDVDPGGGLRGDTPLMVASGGDGGGVGQE